MRRIVLIITLLATVGPLLASGAGADDTHTYKLAMYNAFGLVKGSEVKVADVNTGTITDLSINSDKQAVATVELSGPLSSLGEDTICTSEPQSLIAEYFIDCVPKGKPLPEGATLPAKQVKLTVQNDLVFNTLRMPFNQRLQLLINEFGTALAGNPEELNQAIRNGAPALENLHKALKMVADQNTTIRDLTSNSDRIVARLTERKADVVRFIKEAGDTAQAASERRNDLSTNFDLLDNFLQELEPTATQLASTSRNVTPLLGDLRQAAPGLTTLSKRLPPFARSTQTSLVALGRASQVGKVALKHANQTGVIKDLAASGQHAFGTADPLAKFFQDLDSPKRAVEEDLRASNQCPAGTSKPKTKPCYSTGRKAPTGYTGLEGLLNYAYYQAGSTNQYDASGHILHFTLDDVFAGQCGNFNADSSKVPVQGLTTAPGSSIHSLSQLGNCVGWLGMNQPGVTTPNLGSKYDPSACPQGSTDLSVCDPNGPKQHKAKRRTSAKKSTKAAPSKSQDNGTSSSPQNPGNPQAPNTAPQDGSPNVPDTGTPLDGILGGGNGGSGNGTGGGLGGALGGALNGASAPDHSNGNQGSGNAAQDLLDYLFS